MARLLLILLGSTQLMWSQENLTKNMTICWDTSSSMVARDLEKDFSVLEDYFKDNQKIEVQLLLFGITVEETFFSISNGNWSQLRDELNAVIYDGATIFSNLNNQIKNTDVFVFTDGNRLFEKDILLLPNNSLLVNSSNARDFEFLERTVLLNRGRLIDFSKTVDGNESAKDVMIESDGIQNNLEGIVFIDNKPSAYTRVAIKGSSESIETDASGKFLLSAKVGDTLVVSSIDSRTLRVIPIEFLSYTKIFLKSNIISLEEVTVIQKKQQLEVLSNGYNKYTSDQLGYLVETIDEDELSAVETSVGDAIRNKVSGVAIGTKNSSGVEGGLAQTEIRGRNTLNLNPNALVVVDGIPINRSSRNRIGDRGSYGSTIENFSFLDPGNIKKVTVLKGLAATNIWGSAGSNGVILITTKTASTANGQNSNEDSARLKNNIYNENTEFTGSTSVYKKAFDKTKNLEQAYGVYQTLKKVNSENTMLYIEAFSFFKNKDKRGAAIILSNLWEKNPRNTEVLKILSLGLSTVEEYSLATIINNEILNKNPKDLNAHLNNALNGNFQDMPEKAITELVALLNGGSKYTLETSGISKTLNREIRNLVFTTKTNLSRLNIDTKYNNNLKFKVRIVFEWNHSGAEFEIQFVNPQNRFYSWKHTNDDNKNRLRDEIELDYRLEEFEFSGDGIAGKWIINATALEDFKTNDDKLPLVLKASIYKDFGSTEQSKEEVLVYFTEFNEKKNLISLKID